MNESPSSPFQANLQRGELLRHQGRNAEAETFFKQAITEQPTQAEGYYQLAFCYCNWNGHGKQALDTVDRAITLDPNRSDSLALRAWILGNLKKHQDAIHVAGRALELNPNNILALNAQTRACIALHDWALAEENARHTLSINARNGVASNYLALALRQQGRLDESQAVSASLLSQTPDNPLAQSNAGWTSLQAGDYERANQHFLEALRLEPNNDSARRGMLHSFNSRVWIYRIYFQFIAWIGRHRKSMRYFFIFVIYVVYRLVLSELREFGQEGVDWAFVVVALYFVIFGFGRSFANLFLLLDPFARYALTRKEKGWSLFAGLIYGVIVSYLLSDRAWMQSAVLLSVIAFFLWGVLSIRIQDALSQKSSANMTVD